MVVLDATIANIALPFIGADLDISQANLTWIVTGYALAFGGLLLLGGRLGDLYGRRRVFMIGLTVFAVASLLGGLAPTRPLLLARPWPPGPRCRARLPRRPRPDHHDVPGRPGPQPRVRGVRRHVRRRCGRRPDPRWLAHRPRPEIFGIDVDGWRLTFLINVPIGLVAAFLAPRFLTESESHPGELDVPGAVTGTLGLLGVVYGLTRAGEPARLGRHAGRSPASSPASLLLGRLRAHRVAGSSTRCCPFRIFPNRTRAGELRGDDARAGGDVRDVLLPQPVHPARHGLQPAAHRLRVPAVLLRHRDRRRSASNLVNRVDPRFIAGIGTLLAAAALFGFSRLSRRPTPRPLPSATDGHLGTDVSYWTTSSRSSS